eukprot:gnl/Ergobibamus_cyprinoides/702.p1 GENE.gnl/Ergobibamus_cyprinoides/702~~gnl/Ergobibamus_cyprinoides/702.p1  ORF type:complete len:204 (+),score=48.17 gnl/Ergobibamus_cyprinoides/702:26-613(+)
MPEFDEEQFIIHFARDWCDLDGTTCPPDRYADYLLNGTDAALRYYFAALHEILDADYADITTTMRAYDFIRYSDLRNIVLPTYMSTVWAVAQIDALGTEGRASIAINSLYVAGVVAFAFLMILPFIMHIAHEETQIDMMTGMIGAIELSLRQFNPESGPVGIKPTGQDSLWRDIYDLETQRSGERPSVTFARTNP